MSFVVHSAIISRVPVAPQVFVEKSLTPQTATFIYLSDDISGLAHFKEIHHEAIFLPKKKSIHVHGIP